MNCNRFLLGDSIITSVAIVTALIVVKKCPNIDHFKLIKWDKFTIKFRGHLSITGSICRK